MNTSQRMIWNLYTGAIGAITTVVAAKLVGKAWEAATGNTPPQPNDPEVPMRHAVTWLVASGLGIGLAQLLMNRLAAHSWARFVGTPPRGRASNG